MKTGANVTGTYPNYLAEIGIDDAEGQRVVSAWCKQIFVAP